MSASTRCFCFFSRFSSQATCDTRARERTPDNRGRGGGGAHVVAPRVLIVELDVAVGLPAARLPRFRLRIVIVCGQRRVEWVVECQGCHRVAPDFPAPRPASRRAGVGGGVVAARGALVRHQGTRTRCMARISRPKTHDLDGETRRGRLQNYEFLGSLDLTFFKV